MILPSPQSIMQVAELLWLVHRQERNSQQILFGKNITLGRDVKFYGQAWSFADTVWWYHCCHLPFLTSFVRRKLQVLTAVTPYEVIQKWKPSGGLYLWKSCFLVGGAQSYRKHRKFHSRSTDQEGCSAFPSFSCINSLLQGKPHVFWSRMGEKNLVV